MNNKRLGSLVVVSMVAVQFTVVAAEFFPDVIALPPGWGPEGIASGRGTEFYVGARQGSPVAGAIYKGDFRTGTGAKLVEEKPGRFALGLKFDPRTDLLFVAGGASGAGFVYDAITGEDVATFQFASPPTFINDVIVTRDAAYFTDSLNAAIYAVPLGTGGSLTNATQYEVLPLSGDFVMTAGFNSNGIVETQNGEWLIIVQSSTGLLYRVDPQTGEATFIDLNGEFVNNGDGLLMKGNRLYVVRNAVNLIAVVDLDQSFTTGTYAGNLSNPDFSTPTTIAAFGHSLYAVNARFSEPIPGTEYQVVRVSK